MMLGDHGIGTRPKDARSTVERMAGVKPSWQRAAQPWQCRQCAMKPLRSVKYQRVWRTRAANCVGPLAAGSFLESETASACSQSTATGSVGSREASGSSLRAHLKPEIAGRKVQNAVR